MPIFVFAQAGKYVLRGKIAELNSPAKLYLVYNKAIIGSVTLNKGAFEFKGNISQPTEAYLTLNKTGGDYTSDNYAKFYIEAGNISVISTDSLAKAHITGTKNNDASEQYKLEMLPIDKRDNELEALNDNATEAQKSSPDFLDNLRVLNKKLEDDRKGVNKNFILNNPSSLVSLNALYSFAMYSQYDDIQSLYDKLSSDVKATVQGKAYAQTLQKMEALAVGRVAPDFELPDTSGNPVKLSSFKGKYVLLDFWASWCPLCRQANPDIVKTYKQHNNKNFTILGVSLDKPGDKERWLKAIHHDGLLWTQISELKSWQSYVVNLYNITALPQNLLIDPDGKIIARELDGNELAEKLAVIFNK